MRYSRACVSRLASKVSQRGLLGEVRRGILKWGASEKSRATPTVEGVDCPRVARC